MPFSYVSAGLAVYGALTADSGGGSQSAGTADSAATQSSQTAADMWNYYKANYQPLESNLIGQATAAGSPAEFARARGAANADVTGSFDQTRKQSLSRLQSYGINPGSPAYQSTAASTDIAEGATKAGALTAADNSTRNLAYSKALDVVGLGRNIPAQSAASSANAANAATNASRNQFAQNTQRQQNAGYGLNQLGGAAKSWFGNNSAPPYNASTSSSGGFYDSGNSLGADVGGIGAVPYAKGGTVTREGAVIDAEKTGNGTYDATALKGVLQKKGLNPMIAHEQAHGAAARHKGNITPHMRHRFADGGGVGRQGLEGQDASDMGELQGPGTGTSDSIPAQIDGQQPAALSTGEVVVNADAVSLTGDEILQAINEAGLRKRQQHGMEPRTSNDVPADAGSEAYADGGEVKNLPRRQILRDRSQSRGLQDAAPKRHMMWNSDPARKVDTGMPNIYHGELQPDLESGNSLPETLDRNRLIRLSDGGEVDKSWYRSDGSKKGNGFLGPLKFHDGRTSSELSIGVNIGGKEMDIPSLVPTLSQQELQHLLSGGKPTQAIVQKAADHAKMRMQQGKPVFAQEGEQVSASKPAKKTQADWDRESSERSQGGGLPGNPYYSKLPQSNGLDSVAPIPNYIPSANDGPQPLQPYKDKPLEMTPLKYASGGRVNRYATAGLGR